MSTLAATNLKHASSGSNNIVLASDGTTTIAAPSNIIKSGTSVASTSGTAIDFTGIPSWVKRITVMFNGVSTNGTSEVQIQLGAGSVTTSGYAGSCIRFSSTSGTGSDFTTGFVIRLPAASFARNGNMICALVGSNVWTSNYNFGTSNNETALGAGSIALSGTLDRVRITTVNGTDTFDAGTINILYEG